MRHFSDLKLKIMTERLTNLKELLVDTEIYTTIQITDDKMGIEREKSGRRTMQYGATCLEHDQMA